MMNIIYIFFSWGCIGRPGIFNMRDRAKWDAWKAVEGTPPPPFSLLSTISFSFTHTNMRIHTLRYIKEYVKIKKLHNISLHKAVLRGLQYH